MQQGTAQSEHRLIAAGFGGQGILTLGKLLCKAALGEGKQVAYLPSYGSEVRGGTANCQIVIGTSTIYSPTVEAADELVILNQLSYEKFADRLKDDGVMVANTSGVELADSHVDSPQVIGLPATDMAADLGNIQVANIVMLGGFLAARPLVTRESALAALRELLGERKADMMPLNERAFDQGAERVGGGPVS